MTTVKKNRMWISLIWFFSAFSSRILPFFGCQLFLQVTDLQITKLFLKLKTTTKTKQFYSFYNPEVFSTPISTLKVTQKLLKVHNVVDDALKNVSDKPTQ